MAINHRWLMQWSYDAIQTLYSEAPYRLSRSGRAFPPWHYFLELTRRCNLRCMMCQYSTFLEGVALAEQDAGELTTEEWKRVIDQTGRFSFLTFTGGEPLLRKDFPELLEYASRRTRTHLVSNAVLLDEAMAQRFVQLAPKRAGGRGLNFIGVSLEGPPDFHDEIRRRKGAFSKAAAGLQELQQYRSAAKKNCPYIHITTVIQARNVDVLPQMPRITAELGGDVLNLVTETRMHDLPGLGDVSPGKWRAEDVDWPRIPYDDLRQALEETDREAQRHGVELRMPRMPREELLRYYSDQVDVKDYCCRNPWNTVFIGRTGDVYPCWLMKIGNVREQPLKVIWNDKKARGFRRACRTGLFPLCPGCCHIEYKGAEHRNKGDQAN